MASKRKENQRNQSEDNSTPETPVNPISNGDIGNNANPISPAEKSAKHTHKEQNHAIVVNISQPIAEGEGANKTSWWTVRINAGLFICTLVLAVISVWQGCLTRKSIDIASGVFKADTLYNFKNLKHQKTADSNARISDSIKNWRDEVVFNAQKEFYANSKKGIDAQIDNFKKIQKNFDDGNAPYLKVKLGDDVAFEVGKPVSIILTYENIGVFPARIISSKTGVVIGHTNPAFLVDTEKNIAFSSDYIDKTSPSGQNLYNIIPPLDKNQARWFNEGFWSVYVEGDIEYINAVTKRKRYYKFIFQISKLDNKTVFNNLMNDQDNAPETNYR